MSELNDAQFNWIKNQLIRRINYVCEAWRSAVDYEVLQGFIPKIEGCSSLEDLKAIVAKISSTRDDNPVQWYAKDIVEHGLGIRTLTIKEDDIVPTDSGWMGSKLRNGLTEGKLNEAFQWGQEALLAWAHWVPKCDKGIYERKLDLNLVYSDYEKRCVQSLLDELITNDDQKVLILQYYSDIAYVEDARLLKPDVFSLFLGADDYIILPLTDKPAEWIITYFHHDSMEIGKLTGEWIHNVNINV